MYPQRYKVVKKGMYTYPHLAIGYLIKPHDYFIDIDDMDNDNLILDYFYTRTIIKTEHGYHILSYFPFSTGQKLLNDVRNAKTVVRIHPSKDFKLLNKGFFISSVTNEVYKQIFHQDIAYNIIYDDKPAHFYFYIRDKYAKAING